MNVSLRLVPLLLAFQAPAFASDDSGNADRIEALLKSIERNEKSESTIPMPGVAKSTEDVLVPLLAKELLRLRAENEQLKAAIRKLDPKAELEVPAATPDKLSLKCSLLLLHPIETAIEEGDAKAAAKDFHGARVLYAKAQAMLDVLPEAEAKSDPPPAKIEQMRKELRQRLEALPNP